MKWNRIVLITLIISVMLSACTAPKLADIFDENAVIEQAKEIVGNINALDFDSVNAKVRADLQEQLPAEKLREIMGQSLTDAGGFVEYTSIVTMGQKSKSTGEDYATAVLVCEYENSTIIYTISMDVNLDIVGIYIK